MEGRKTEEARPGCNRRARHAANGEHSLPDEWERGTFWGGMIFALSFGLMFLHAGMVL